MLASVARRAARPNHFRAAFVQVASRPQVAPLGRSAAARSFVTEVLNWRWGSKVAAAEKKLELERTDEKTVADHSWRQTNHWWSEAELKKVDLSEHTPVTFSDHAMRGLMRIMYHSFNFVTGYDHRDPTPESVAWRLIILESFAGVPGFVAAGFRHFHSLRTLQRDHGSIYTFLEEAENERMHLLVCMKMFEASTTTKILCMAAQVIMTPFLMGVYIVKRGAMHRFVGYLEETAVLTYANLVEKASTPGFKLHSAWAGLPAPDIAKSYWKLEDGATWVDTLRHILADESHHRDVNHTFATLPEGAENPFIKKHMKDFDKAAALRGIEVQAALAKAEMLKNAEMLDKDVLRALLAKAEAKGEVKDAVA